MTLTEGLADLGSVLGALQKASNIIKDWASFGTDKERAAKISEINGQILAAQTSAIQANAAQASLIEQIGTLKEKIAQFETWDNEKIRYELSSIGDGATAFTLKKDTQSAGPPHWLCTKCYQIRKKGFFNYQSLGPSGPDAHKAVWGCNECGGKIVVSRSLSPGRSHAAHHQ